MRSFFSKMVGLCLSAVILTGHADATQSTNNPNLLSLNSIAPTAYPTMALLKGVLLVVKYTNLTKVSKADFFGSDGFIVGRYIGPNNMNYVNSPVLVEDLSQVQTINNLNFFSQFDPNKTGVISEQVMRQAQLVLLYYNYNGYLLMRSMANYGIHSLAYNTQTNQVKLNLYDVQARAKLNADGEQNKQFQIDLSNQSMNKYLQGELVNFG